MKIVSLCPFNVATVLWEARAAEWTLTVVVKATFVLRHGQEAAVAEEQEPVGDDRYWDDDPSASVHTPSDFVPFKPRADIMLVGHAYAPKDAPATALDARLRVGDFSKAVRVIGDRGWVRAGVGWMPGPSRPFAKMPLRYERASIGTDNPVGIDPKALASTGAPALPNLESLGDVGSGRGFADVGSGRGFADVGSGRGFADVGMRAPSYDGISARPSDQRPQAPCFGPLASTWRARRGLVSDQAFLWALGFRGDRRLTASTAPSGFDFGFFNAAPRDQQVDLLRIGANIVLENMNPEHAWFETRLPGVRPKVFLPDATTGRPREVALRADTLWIDTDRAIATVVWRGLTSVAGMADDDRTRMIVVAESKGQPTRMAVIDRLLREGSRDSMTDEQEDEANLLNQRHDAVKPHRPAPNMRFAPIGAAEPGDEPFDRTPTEKIRQWRAGQDADPAWATEGEPTIKQPIQPPADPSPAALSSAPDGAPPTPVDPGREGAAQGREATQEFQVPTLPSHAPLPFLRPTLISAKQWAPSAGAEGAPAPSDAPAPGDAQTGIAKAVAMLSPQPATPRAEAPTDLAGQARPAGAPSEPPRPGPPRPGPPRPAVRPPDPPRPAVRLEPSEPQSADRTSEIVIAPAGSATPFEGSQLDEPESTSDFDETAPMADTLPPDLVGDKAASLQDEDDSDAVATPKPAFLRGSSPDHGAVSASRAGSDPAQPGDVTVEHYAQICAELAERPTERAAILAEHGFADALWRDVDSRWRSAIAKEVEGGQSEILARYDTAYIAAQERFRDPIGVGEYAQILLGVERGEVGLVLGQLKLRLSDLMRLQRVWTKRLASDAQLASELAAALAAARKE